MDTMYRRPVCGVLKRRNSRHIACALKPTLARYSVAVLGASCVTIQVVGPFRAYIPADDSVSAVASKGRNVGDVSVVMPNGGNVLSLAVGGFWVVGRNGSGGSVMYHQNVAGDRPGRRFDVDVGLVLFCAPSPKLWEGCRDRILFAPQNILRLEGCRIQPPPYLLQPGVVPVDGQPMASPIASNKVYRPSGCETIVAPGAE